MTRRFAHVMIVNDFPPVIGGQSGYLHKLCLCFPSGQLTVLAPSIGDTMAFDKAQPFDIIRKPYLVDLPVIEKFLKILVPFCWALGHARKRQIGLLHCAHVLSTGFVGLALKAWTGTEYVLYTHGADVLEYQGSVLLGPWLRRILTGARYVVANSRFTSSKLAALGVDPGRIIISPPRIDPSEFEGAKDAHALWAKYGLDGAKVILGINRLVERKGNDMVIRSMPEILRQIPEAKYVIFGRGPQEASLRRLVDDLGLGQVVVFIDGTDEERKGLLRGCSVLAMASRQGVRSGDVEGFGIVFLEANAAGKPVVAGDSGGVPDAVEDGITGFLVDPLDPQAIAAMLIRLLRDEALAGRMGAAGRARVRDLFDCRKGSPELMPVFQEDFHV